MYKPKGLAPAFTRLRRAKTRREPNGSAVWRSGARLCYVSTRHLIATVARNRTVHLEVRQMTPESGQGHVRAIENCPLGFVDRRRTFFAGLSQTTSQRRLCYGLTHSDAVISLMHSQKPSPTLSGPQSRHALSCSPRR